MIQLKKGADPGLVAEELRRCGITLHRSLGGGRYVAFIHRRKWLLMLYPALEGLYKEDRAFWREVRKRTRKGEPVAMGEIEAHAKEFKEREKRIIESYERQPENYIKRDA